MILFPHFFSSNQNLWLDQFVDFFNPELNGNFQTTFEARF